jgi:hypothetical protein
MCIGRTSTLVAQAEPQAKNLKSTCSQNGSEKDDYL